MLLLQLSRAAARSCRKHIPPKLGSCVASTTPLAALTAPVQLRRPLSQYSAIRQWQQTTTGGWHPEHVAPSPKPVGFSIRAAKCGAQFYSPQSGNLARLMFQRNISGSGLNWMPRVSKKSSSWLRPRRNAQWGGLYGSRVRHFGGGSYVDPQLALGALIATNFGVFFLWRTLGGRFMESNFVVSAQALKEGRFHTLVTSIFSQVELPHLLSNMIGLYFFGSEIGSLFGGHKLILLYLTGGIVGSLTHLAYWYFKPWFEGYPRRFSRHSPGLLGSSGAVNAIILLDILLFPKRIIYMNLIIPVPAALVGMVIIGSDLWAATAGSKNGTSPAAHLGGAVVGALAWLRWR